MRMWKLVCAMLLVTGAALAQEQKEATAKKPKILIAWEKTRFKSKLVEAVKKQLESTGAEITLVRHSKKGLDAKAADYDAIFITNSGVHSKVRPWIIKWLETNKEQKDRILLHTTQTRDWKVTVTVDAVTSASSKKEVEKFAADYVGRLKKILEK